MNETEQIRKKRSFFTGLLKSINIIRLVIINLLFFGGVFLGIILIAFALKKDRLMIPAKSLLLIAPASRVVEEYTVTDLALSLDEMTGSPPREILLDDVIKSIEKGRTDKRIDAVFIDCRYFYITTLSGAQEFRIALQHFKESGKKVIVYSDFYNQLNYLYGSEGDEIFLNPIGSLSLPGFALNQPYFGDGLNRLQVEVNVFRSGEYKSFVEPFTRTGMSDHVRAQNLSWLNPLWDNYLSFLAVSTGKTHQALKDYSLKYHVHMVEFSGDSAEAALKYGLITGKKNYLDVSSDMILRYGKDDKTGSFKAVPFESYLKDSSMLIPSLTKGRSKIAVLYGTGDIIYGNGYYGKMGSATYASIIQDIKQDPEVKAVVFRLNSGGGSSFASEEIRRSIAELRGKGIPVVVSMGDIAASGAYWIAVESDWITAYRTTITGSIGVFSIVPTFEKTLEKFAGITFDGVSTGPMAGGYSAGQPLGDETREVYQQEVEWIYRQFTDLVAEKRDIPKTRLADLAGGRVWNGVQALENGLVDDLGGYQAALAKSAELAGLSLDDCEIKVFRPGTELKGEIPFLNWLSLAFGGQMNKNWIEGLATQYIEDSLTNNDPRGIDMSFPGNIRYR